jgi:hypothetical protein
MVEILIELDRKPNTTQYQLVKVSVVHRIPWLVHINVQKSYM